MGQRYLGKIVDWLIISDTVAIEERELYVYALYAGFLSICPMLVMTILGFLSGHMVENILTILPFCFIRKFSGGYHAKRPEVCFIASGIILLVCNYCVGTIEYSRWMGILTVLAILCLACLSPVDHENRKLIQEERMCYRKITIKILIVLVECIVMALIVNQKQICVYLLIGIILSAVLQIPCLLGTVLMLIKSEKKTK